MMKIRSEYRLREMAGEQVAVAPGEAETAVPTRILALNASARALWNLFRGREFSAQQVAEALTERYNVSPERARSDARKWIGQLVPCGIIES